MFYKIVLSTSLKKCTIQAVIKYYRQNKKMNVVDSDIVHIVMDLVVVIAE
jgi:hypothetical protein